DHDQQREQEEGYEDGAPGPSPPPPPGLLWVRPPLFLRRGAGGGHRREPDEQRGEDQDGRVDGSAVAAARLGPCEQREVPRPVGPLDLLLPTRARRRHADSQARKRRVSVIALRRVPGEMMRA